MTEQTIHTKWLALPWLLNRLYQSPRVIHWLQTVMFKVCGLLGQDAGAAATYETYLFKLSPVGHGGDHLRQLLFLALQDSVHVLHGAL